MGFLPIENCAPPHARLWPVYEDDTQSSVCANLSGRAAFQSNVAICVKELAAARRG
ncbi:protein of unknown function [Hyphomicrobium sp. 1Nfss2.1]